MVDYAKSLATANRLIGENGQTIAIRRQETSGPPHDPTIAETDHAAVGVQTEYSAREIDGTLIAMTDRKWLIRVEGLDIVPTTADKLVVAGKAHAIKDVAPLNPGGTTLLYKLQVAH